MAEDIIFINGEFVSYESARIAIEDRGNLFGDGVYEVIRSYNGKIFCLQEHMQRLSRSLDGIRLPQDILPFGLEETADLLKQAYQKSGYENAKIYIQISRGVASRNHTFPTGVTPTVIITVKKIESNPASTYLEGVEILMLPDIRWGRCNVKSLNLLPNVMAKQEAFEHGKFEAVLERDGYVTEASASNVFAVFDGTIYTHPADNKILAGITRGKVIELLNANGSNVIQRPLTVEQFLSASEIFLTGTTIDIVPVVAVGSTRIADGPGEVFRTLNKLWNRFVSG